MPNLTKHIPFLSAAAKFYRPIVFKKPHHTQKNNEFVEAFEELAKALLASEHNMARAQAAIDKLEARIEEQDAAISARDRKITTLTTQLTTAQANAEDDADLAAIAHVEGQTFNPIPPVDNGGADTTGGDTTGTPATPAPVTPATPATPA